MSFFDKFKSKKEIELAGKSGAQLKSVATKPVGAKKESVKSANKETKSVVKKTTSPKKSYPAIHGVIFKPLISEKSANLAHDSQYTFLVAATASKYKIADALASMYGVRPLRVNVQNYRGKVVHFGRAFGQRKDMKRAIVKFPKNTNLNIYENV